MTSIILLVKLKQLILSVPHYQQYQHNFHHVISSTDTTVITSSTVPIQLLPLLLLYNHTPNISTTPITIITNTTHIPYHHHYTTFKNPCPNQNHHHYPFSTHQTTWKKLFIIIFLQSLENSFMEQMPELLNREFIIG